MQKIHETPKTQELTVRHVPGNVTTIRAAISKTDLTQTSTTKNTNTANLQELKDTRDVHLWLKCKKIHNSYNILETNKCRKKSTHDLRQKTEI
ncbi:jg15020 [Pararge aegeria aegeria]|uniref:Jg15020 protein n=1 Tax=Pararge aegeria aegeria TaxID=348720 RepID=A0A8S4RB40_9NEOP|nr:jg15020 [Pararge aegeria aegeria]